MNKNIFLFFLVCATMVLSGCSHYKNLRNRDFSSIKSSTLAHAGESGDITLSDDIAALLQQRLEEPAKIRQEQAVEAIIALGKLKTREHAVLILELLNQDPSGDVRYFSALTLNALDPDLLEKTRILLLDKERDPIVRKAIEHPEI